MVLSVLKVKVQILRVESSRKDSDPLNETNDVGRSTYHWNQVRQCFDQCCRKLKKALEDQPDPAMRGGTLLGQILQVHHDLLLYRYVGLNRILTPNKKTGVSKPNIENFLT